jgi:hypothetical protein
MQLLDQFEPRRANFPLRSSGLYSQQSVWAGSLVVTQGGRLLREPSLGDREMGRQRSAIVTLGLFDLCLCRKRPGKAALWGWKR